MTAHVTYFDAVTHSDATGYGRASNARGVFGEQLGDAETLANGGVGGVATVARFALIKVTTDHRIAIGVGAAAGAASGAWMSGETDVRYVAAGARVSVAAL